MPEEQQPAAQPMDAMAEALRNHTRDYPTHRGDHALGEVMQLRKEVENMQVDGGKVAWPTVTTKDTGAGNRAPTGSTLRINYFTNGALESANVLKSGSTSSFGPFA